MLFFTILFSNYSYIQIISDCINPYPDKLIYFNFQPLEFVSRTAIHNYRDPQLQVVVNYS